MKMEGKEPYIYFGEKVPKTEPFIYFDLNKSDILHAGDRHTGTYRVKPPEEATEAGIQASKCRNKHCIHCKKRKEQGNKCTDCLIIKPGGVRIGNITTMGTID
jgi:hypothetical protein